MFDITCQPHYIQLQIAFQTDSWIYAVIFIPSISWHSTVIIANLPMMKEFLACESSVGKVLQMSLDVPKAACPVDLVGTILKQVSCRSAIHPAPQPSPLE